jgi:hypothetical protein
MSGRNQIAVCGGGQSSLRVGHELGHDRAALTLDKRKDVAVAGFDTIRGIGFQQASALDGAVDLVLDPEAALLRVEGAEDVVDYETVAADGRRLRVRQAKTRQEPGTPKALGR